MVVESAPKKHIVEGAGAGAMPSPAIAVAVDRQARVGRYVAALRAVWDWDVGCGMCMFHWPVTEAVAPGYSRVVQQPVDLASLRRLAGDASVLPLPAAMQPPNGSAPQLPPVSTLAEAAEVHFPSDEHLHDELALMVSNALQFNQRGSVWYRHAKALKKKLPGLLREHNVAADVEPDPGGGATSVDGGKGDTVYVPSRFVKDDEAMFAKDEQKAGEDLATTLSALAADVEIPLDELRKMYQSDEARARLAQVEREWGGDGETESGGSNEEDGEDEEEGTGECDGESSDFEDSSSDEE